MCFNFWYPEGLQWAPKSICLMNKLWWWLCLFMKLFLSTFLWPLVFCHASCNLLYFRALHNWCSSLAYGSLAFAFQEPYTALATSEHTFYFKYSDFYYYLFATLILWVDKKADSGEKLLGDSWLLILLTAWEPQNRNSDNHISQTDCENSMSYHETLEEQ